MFQFSNSYDWMQAPMICSNNWHNCVEFLESLDGRQAMSLPTRDKIGPVH